MDGMTVREIVERYDVTKSPLSKWITERGLAKVRRLTDEDDDRIAEMYKSGMYAREIADVFNVTTSAITSRLRERGITRGRGVKSLVGNERYFENIDSEEKAYWLGFIMADGSVGEYNGQYYIKISLAVSDRIILERFRDAIESKNSIWEADEKFTLKTSSSYGSVFRKACISISSKIMVESLYKLGFSSNKTGNEFFPDIDDSLKKHFLRGVFDGDGTAYFRKPYFDESGSYVSPMYGFGFISSREMIENIIEFTGLDGRIEEAVGCHKLIHGKKKGMELYDIMYRDATIWLPRKRNTMNEAFDYMSTENLPNKMVQTDYANSLEEAIV